jgi:hypothetical protein
MSGIFRKITVHAPQAQTRDDSSLETGLTGQTHLVVVRYSASNSGVPCNSIFRFEGNAVRVKYLLKFLS